MKRPPRKTGARREKYTIMILNMMQEPAWRELSLSAQAIYVWIKLEWRGPKNNNNGALQLSTRQAAERMGIAPNTAARAFHDLQAKGFLVVTERACLGTDGMARSPKYELTELALPGAIPPVGRMLYRTWQPGNDFPVIKHGANNPEGRNGKTIARRRSEDDAVIDFAAMRDCLSSGA